MDTNYAFLSWGFRSISSALTSGSVHCRLDPRENSQLGGACGAGRRYHLKKGGLEMKHSRQGVGGGDEYRVEVGRRSGGPSAPKPPLSLLPSH